MFSIDKIQKVPPPTRRQPHNVRPSAALCEWSGPGAALLWKHCKGKDPKMFTCHRAFRRPHSDPRSGLCLVSYLDYTEDLGSWCQALLPGGVVVVHFWGVGQKNNHHPKMKERHINNNK